MDECIKYFEQHQKRELPSDYKRLTRSNEWGTRLLYDNDDDDDWHLWICS